MPNVFDPRHFARGGAAVVLPDAGLDGPRLRGEVEDLLGDAARLESMAAASRALARPDAAARIADDLLTLAL